MLNTDGQYRLVFCSNANTPLDLFVNALRQANFISTAIFPVNDASLGSDNEYCVGDAFLASITFMGCSPYIEFEPPAQLQDNDSADFCFIRLSAMQQQLVYHAGQFESLKTIPRCKQCRKIIADWAAKAESLNINWQLSCSHCEMLLKPVNLDWRKASGVGNVFIEVMNVYLQEAVPTDAFMQQLETMTGSQWHYFYTNSNLKTSLLDKA